MQTPTTAQRIGATVRAEAARRRINQDRMAQQLKLTQSAVSRRLLGRVAFSVDELAALSELLEVPVSDLIGETGGRDGVAAKAVV